MSHNLQTEQAVLGIFLVDGEKIKQTTLAPEHFSRHDHRRIFLAMQQVDNNGTPVDMVTVTTSLGGEIAQVGEVSYLLGLAESVPTTENFHFYEKLLVESYTNQQMRQSAIKYIENPSADALLGLKQQLHLMDQDPEADEQTVKEQLSDIAMEMISSPVQTGLATGFEDYDKMTGGAWRFDHRRCQAFDGEDRLRLEYRHEPLQERRSRRPVQSRNGVQAAAAADDFFRSTHRRSEVALDVFLSRRLQTFLPCHRGNRRVESVHPRATTNRPGHHLKNQSLRNF